MRNIWTQSVEMRNVNNRIEQENDILKYYYFTDRAKLKNRIQKISQAVINEIWTEDSELRQHVKKTVEELIHKKVYHIVERDYKEEDNLFNFVMLTTLDEIEICNKIYKDMFLRM